MTKKKDKAKRVKATKAKEQFSFKQLFVARKFPNPPSLKGPRPIESITLEEFGIRVRNFGGDSMKVMYSFVKVIALTTATIVFMQLLFKTLAGFHNTHWSFHGTINWYLCFNYMALLISFVVLMITYEAPMFGALFVYQSPPWWVTLVPALFAVCEFLVFAVLSPTFFTESLGLHMKVSESNILLAWYVINALYHFLISWFCFRAADHFTKNIAEDLDDEMRPVFTSYRDDVELERTDSFKGAVALSLGSVAAAVIPAESVLAIGIHALLLATTLALVMRSFIEQHKKRGRVIVAYQTSVQRRKGPNGESGPTSEPSGTK